MAAPSNRQSKSSNKSVQTQVQVVDVTPLNSADQSQTSSKIDSSSTKNLSSTRTSVSNKLSNGSGSPKPPSGKNNGFETNLNSIWINETR